MSQKKTYAFNHSLHLTISDLPQNVRNLRLGLPDHVAQLQLRPQHLEGYLVQDLTAAANVGTQISTMGYNKPP